MKRLLVACLALAGTAAQASDSELPSKTSQDASVRRGKIVFLHYCALCHGVNADGAGRAAKLYNPKPANLLKSDKNAQYRQLIIRQGGKALGRSESMPSWKAELTDEQVNDTVAYLGSIQTGARDAK